MSRYKILYIDEDSEDRQAFEIYFEGYPDDFEIIAVSPGGKSIPQLVQEIIQMDADIVIIDFNLKYKDDTVPDNGDVIMQRISDRKPLLPVVLLTSYKQLAKDSFLSPEKRKSILEKSLLNDPKNEDLKNEVLSYIRYYRNLIDRYKTEMSELSLSEPLAPENKARIVELDSILEESVDRQSAIKSQHKADENLEQLRELINSTKDLIREIKSAPND